LTTYISPGVEMAFVWIPAGSFQMGSIESEQGRFPDEGPAHEVSISAGFWLGKYEVTQAQWQGVMGSNPSRFTGDSRRPVEQVSWDDVQGLLQKVNGSGGSGYRLPSEAQWEYACRAGTRTRYSFGDGDGQLGDRAWYDGNAGATTHLVGQKRPNAWGLYDMHGNVLEWCADDWHDRYSGAPTDGRSWDDSPRADWRVLRGGCWYNSASFCRSAGRGGYDPSLRGSGRGFRLARTR
jgi:formylglycine-generating enzyme required for sulfatase activity